MRLYSGSSDQFITDTWKNQITGKLENSFFSYFLFHPSPGEINSWQNSLRAVSFLFEHADLRDHGIILEYQLPLTSCRLDCMIMGKDAQKKDNAVIIELKQWNECENAEGDNEVITRLGGVEREVLHPSAQVGKYKTFLEDGHTAFYEGEKPVVLNACSYLHNYNFKERDVLLSDKFSNLLESFPLFSGADADELSDYLVSKLEKGQGLDVLSRIEKGKYRPSKKLMDHVGKIIKGNPAFTLLDEQQVAYDRVIASARKGFHDRRKTAIIIKGGPGTGKSVIAINLMADLLLKGYNAHYVTGSRAFTQTLRKIIGRRGEVQFKYFNSYMQADRDAVDVMICDESHRIREKSAHRFTPRHQRTGLPQIQELINAARVAVFFIDQDQGVRPFEIGSVDYILDYAEKNNCRIHEYELKTQFRCSGSKAFVNWINNTLDIRRTANVVWSETEEFDFRIFDSPFSLENAIREKAREGYTARMTAGFCWKWSKYPKSDGTLNDDVVIGNYKRPWNARSGATRLAKGIPKAPLWAYEPGGINQIGCVYTAQGFEFDYVGVIFGNDLVYNPQEQTWEGRPENSGDPVVRGSKDRFLQLVKNTYRVLLSRGLKGCYVYFMDKDTEEFFKSRMGKVPTDQIEIPERPQEEKIIPFENALPLFDLRAVADASYSSIDGYFSDESNFTYVPVRGGPFGKDRFLIKAEGDSMEPRIPAGSLCLFKKYQGGTRNNKIVLCRIENFAGEESVALIKKYNSFRVGDEDTIGETQKIVLSSLHPKHPNIEISEEGSFSVIGVFEGIVEEKGE